MGCSNIHYHTGPAHCYPRLESSPPASGRGLSEWSGMTKYTITPHILARSDGKVLCLPADDTQERQGIAIFTSREVAEELAPDGFEPLYCGPEELLLLAECLHVWLVCLLSRDGELNGSVLTTDVFAAALEGEM